MLLVKTVHVCLILLALDFTQATFNFRNSIVIIEDKKGVMYILLYLSVRGQKLINAKPKLIA